MDANDIQRRIDRLSDAMLAKGLKTPDPTATLRAHTQPYVHMAWEDAREAYGRAFEVVRGDSIEDAFDAAEQIIAAMPDAEQRKFHEFMGALSNVIDLGRDNGIDVEFINPLVELSKALSENALTYQPGA